MSVLPAAIARSHFQALARPNGGFAMLALDQRGSLETMLMAAGRPVEQDGMDAFRSTALQALAPLASAVLLERGYLGRTQPRGHWSLPCGLIVAADELIQAPGELVTDSLVDPGGATVAVELGAQAIKLLVLWFAGEDNERQGAVVDAFVDLAHQNGLLALVEGIVRPGRGRAVQPVVGDDLLRAAVRFSAGADIYKVQVPTQDGDSAEEVERLSQSLTSAIKCPWVVLSTGVAPDQFAGLVAASCRGGASGFLAGRGIWASSLATGDPALHLAGPAADGLRELTRIVDNEARPWTEIAR